MNIEIKRLHPDAKIPEFQTDGAAGFDLHALIDEPKTLFPGISFLCPTGFAMNMGDAGMAAIIVPRSGLGSKAGIVLGNGTGVIDSDYQGQIFASLVLRKLNASDQYVIRPGDRIAQMFFVPIIRPNFNIVDDFTTETERGSDGFGSTGE